MNLSKRLRAIEESPETIQAAMLQTAQSFGGFYTQCFAAVLDGLADRGALVRGCPELRRLAKEYSDRPADELEEPPIPDWTDDLKDSAVISLILWDVFTATPESWRLPNGEAALLADLQSDDESCASMSINEYRQFLNSELDRLAKIKPKGKTKGKP